MRRRLTALATAVTAAATHPHALAIVALVAVVATLAVLGGALLLAGRG